MSPSDEYHASDGDQEIWAAVVETRRRPLRSWGGVLLAVALLLGACTFGVTGVVGAIAFFVATRSDPTRTFATDDGRPLRRYRRLRLDAHGIRVDWLDEVVGRVTDEMLFTARGQREQRVDWEDIAQLELAAPGVILITKHDGSVRALAGLGEASTPSIYERLQTVWSGKQRGAASPDDVRARRSQLERLRSDPERGG